MVSVVYVSLPWTLKVRSCPSEENDKEGRREKRKQESEEKRKQIFNKTRVNMNEKMRDKKKEKVERKGRGRQRRETLRRPGDLFCVHPTPPETEQVRKREVHTPGVHFAGITCKKTMKEEAGPGSIQEARDSPPFTRTRASFGNNQVLAYSSLLSCESFSP